MMKIVKLTEIIRDVVSATSSRLLTQLKQVDPRITGIHFKYGHYTDIQAELNTEGKTVSKVDRFPLIALFEDFRIRHSQEGLYGISDMKLIALHYSDKTFTRQQREDSVFVPILYPIYQEFLRQLKMSGKFQIYDETKIVHDQINRPHWGDPSLYRNEGYLFNEVLDGIELSNLQLQTYLKIC